MIEGMTQMSSFWAQPVAPFVLMWIFFSTIAAATYIERQPYGKYIPGILFILVVPAVLSNLDLIPNEAPLYGQIGYFAVPVGVVLLLLRADLKEILRSSGVMLPVFVLAGLGSLISLLIVAQFIHLESGSTVAATLTALFIGSVINVVATAQALQLDDTLLGAVLAANAIMAPLYLAVILMLMSSRLPGKLTGTEARNAQAEGSTGVEAAAAPAPPKPQRPLGTMIAICYSIGLFILVDIGSTWAGLHNYSIMIVTVFAVAIPNLFPSFRNHVDGDKEIGMTTMFLFVAVVSAQLDIGQLGWQAVKVMLFIGAGLTLNMVFLVLIGRLFKADPHIVLLAALAGYGGPTSTAAVAAMQKREDLVTPGILCALFGVIISTFVAVLSFQIFEALS